MPIYDQVTNPPRQALLVTDDQAAIAEARAKIRQSLEALADADRALEQAQAGLHSLSADEVRGEAWEMPVDAFLSEMIAVACGGVSFHGGMWNFGSVRVCCRDHLGTGAEEGWYRWRLPSADGVVRLFDWSAPWVMRSPSGAFFWCEGRKQTRVTIGEMLSACSDLAERVAA